MSTLLFFQVVTEIIESTVSSASPAENAVLVEENDQVQPVIAQQPSGIVKRSRRQVPTALSETDATTLIVERPYFKGIIQDVQISDGLDVTRIVEFFKNDVDDFDGKPEEIGKISDNTFFAS